MEGLRWNRDTIRYAGLVIGIWSGHLALLFGLPECEREEAASTMWLDLLGRAKAFDPALSCAHTFIGTVVRNEYRDLVAFLWSVKGRARLCALSLDAPLPTDAPDSEPLGTLIPGPSSFTDTCDLRIDVSRLLATASDDLRVLAERLAEGTVTWAAHWDGVPRTTLQNRKRRLRELLEPLREDRRKGGRFSKSPGKKRPRRRLR